ncbi:hypothetical protein PG987_006820 [Apiospora arundinis]
MDRMPPEILHLIALWLSIDDACNLRLVNKAFSVVAAAYILPEVTFQLHEKSLARLRSIAAHPVLSRHVKSLGYISKRYESEPVPYAEFVSDVKRNEMVKKLQPDAFTHLPPIVPRSHLPQHYELYKQKVIAQRVLDESQADALCLQLILPKLTNLQQVTMSAGNQYYEGFTKKTNPYEDGCLRQPTFDGKPLGIAIWRFFQKDPEELHRLFKPFKEATYIDLALGVDTDENGVDVTGDTSKCRACLRSGIIADILQSMPKLNDIAITFLDGEVDISPTSLSHIITPGYQWTNLARLEIDSVDCERVELWNFLLLHKDTLSTLCLRDVAFTKGSWRKILVDIRKVLFLRHPCICGTLQGFAENEDGSSGPPEVFELSLGGPCDMRSSVNCYCTRGGEIYPDHLPLTDEIVDRYFDSHVRPTGVTSEAEDEAVMKELMLKSHRRRIMLDITDPGWDRISEGGDEHDTRERDDDDPARFGDPDDWETLSPSEDDLDEEW